MPFSDFIGNAETVQRLREMLGRGHFPHAVILAGARGSGKYTLALMLARAMNCLENQERVAKPSEEPAAAGLLFEEPPASETESADAADSATLHLRPSRFLRALRELYPHRSGGRSGCAFRRGSRDTGESARNRQERNSHLRADAPRPSGDSARSSTDDDQSGPGAARYPEHLLPACRGARKGVHLHQFGVHEGSGEFSAQDTGRASRVRDHLSAHGKSGRTAAHHPVTFDDFHAGRASGFGN